ncbi:MAG TPA: hypothetical protein H9887_07580 [Candidatus Dorea intestinavium]|nr:hypothetical protein [Candidatus Dorea intestinavium]
MSDIEATQDKNTIISHLTQWVPYYLSRYVDWYMSKPEDRVSWEDLAKCHANYRSKGGKNKTPRWAEENWLPRGDVQKAMQEWIKFFRKKDMALLYRNMMDKAMKGDTKAADWVVKFGESDFFDDSADEMDSFLSGLNIPALKGKV